MRSINYRELRRMVEGLGVQQTARRLGEALLQKHLAPDDFSIREIAEATLGAERVREMDPRRGGACLLEAGDGVDATAFSNIAGAVVEAKVLEGYRQEAFVASSLVETVPTRLDGERIAGAGRLGDAAAEVAPGMPYPSVGFGEDYIDTPQTTKRGLIVPVTREAVFFDRTHLVLQRAAEVGEALGLNKEKRILDVILGIENSYRWKGGAYDTYYNADDGTAPWVNEIADALEDWSDVDAAEQRFAEILDPNTGEPVLVQAATVLVTPALRHTANRVFGASEILYGAASSATQTTAPNPLSGYRVVESRLALRRMAAAGIDAADARKRWLVGDFRKAFAYMENWPITVTRSPVGSEAEFSQDVVVRFKASERGAAAVLNPRYVVRATGTGA